jgi:signal transduction histidine kinase
MKSPTRRLIAGLVFTLLVIGAYAAFTLHSVVEMREVQTRVMERNRKGSLQLIRIQNDLNALALALRDMLESPTRYPLSAWKAPLLRIRQNLDDALSIEAALAEDRRSPQQRAYLNNSFAEFWTAGDQVFMKAEAGEDKEARQLVRDTLEPRREALSAMTARLLVENNDVESRAGQQVAEIYSDIEMNVYRFLGVALLVIFLTSVGLIRSNRILFTQLASLAEERRELARQLISTQESTFRAISRDLHDEFGQVLTALGALLRRANKHAPNTEFRIQVHEAGEIVQGTLEKIRSLSQSLQPVILDEQGLLPAIEWHLTVFEKQTGVRVRYLAPESGPVEVPDHCTIHVFRILQEALNNVARHSNSPDVEVSLQNSADELVLAIRDYGIGLQELNRPGVGLAAMRERADLMGGTVDIARAEGGGTLVRLHLPAAALREVADA